MHRFRTARPALSLPRSLSLPLSVCFGALVCSGTLVGCGHASGAASHEETRDETREEGQPVHDTPTATPPSASTTLPADVHAVVFFDGPRGREHIDTHVLSDGATTTIAGVHADESRAHPAPQRVEFTPQERAEYARLVAALATMPRCEPLARLPDEPTWQIEFGGQGDTGPSLWFREDGDALLASDDPCLAYVRLARFFYATWMRGARPR